MKKKSNPIPSRWVTHRLENNSTRSSQTIVKILNTILGSLAWGIDKGNRQGDCESPGNLIIGLPEDWGKQRFQSWRAQPTCRAHQDPEERSSDPTGG